MRCASAIRLAYPIASLVAFASCLVGCTLGPQQIDRGRLEYNRSIHRTFEEEILLNLIRLRYREATEFMSIAGIAAQYNFDQSLGVGSDLREGLPDTLGLSGSLGRSEKPTISYAPLRDAEFHRGLLSPISLETLALLMRTGWRADRILRATVQSINGVDNAISAGGPTPDLKPEFETFRYLTSQIRVLQQHRAIELAQAKRRKRSIVPISLEKIPGDVVLDAVEKGYKIEREDDHTVLVDSEEFAALFVKPEPEVLNSTELHTIIEMLHLIPNRSYYEVHTGTAGQIQPKYSIDPNQTEIVHVLQRPQRDDISISTRSILETMYFLSQGIEVPFEHAAKGMVTVTVDETGAPFDWSEMTGDLLRITNCRKRPECAAVAVKHRGHWFYIDNRDLNSLTTFVLLIELFSIEVRGGGGSNLPVLTIGVGS